MLPPATPVFRDGAPGLREAVPGLREAAPGLREGAPGRPGPLAVVPRFLSIPVLRLALGEDEGLAVGLTGEFRPAPRRGWADLGPGAPPAEFSRAAWALRFRDARLGDMILVVTVDGGCAKIFKERFREANLRSDVSNAAGDVGN